MTPIPKPEPEWNDEDEEEFITILEKNICIKCGSHLDSNNGVKSILCSACLDRDLVRTGHLSQEEKRNYFWAMVR